MSRFTSSSQILTQNRVDFNCLNLSQLVLTLIAFILTIMSPIQGQAGSEKFLFVPGNFTPLSSFQQKLSTTSETLKFSVNAEVLRFILNKSYPGFFMRQDPSGAITGIAPTGLDLTANQVLLQTNLPGKFVFVAEPFTNDLPIVTHWSQSLNSGRGGFQQGAADPIGTLDVNLDNGVTTTSSDYYDTDPASPMLFNTKKFALFSNDPQNPNATVPSLDRYVGENFSILKVTDRLAVFLALKTLETTGYPLIHRNFPWAFYDTSSARKINDALPCFQVAHGVITSPVPDKGSLSTYILPPNWVKNSASPYPVLFNGFYDIHESFFEANGSDFIKVLNRLNQDGFGKAVGVLWNGGGAYGPYSVNFNTYWIAAHAFNLAQYFINADINKVVASGISRGGITALTVAANPFFDNYKVQYALAFSPALQFGDHVSHYLASVYPGNYVAASWGTGYKFGHRTGFIDPLSGLNVMQLLLNNIMGTTDANFGDLISPAGDWIVGKLKSTGVKVLLSSGTHDGFMPFSHQLLFADKLAANLIPLEHHIGHRFGHSYFSDQQGQMLRAMKLMLGGSGSWGGTKHFRRISEADADIAKSVEFIPSTVVFAELPKLVWRNQNLRTTFVGQKGLKYALVYYKIDDQALANGSLQLVGNQNWVISGDFSGPQALQAQTLDITIPADLAVGNYLYLMAYSLDGSNWQLVDLSKVPQPVPYKLPLFEVLASEPQSTASQLSDQLMKSNRGWGLSSN